MQGLYTGDENIHRTRLISSSKEYLVVDIAAVVAAVILVETSPVMEC